MVWKSSSTLRREFKQRGEATEKLSQLYALKQFISYALCDASLDLSEEVARHISLTPQGNEAFLDLRRRRPTVEEHTAKFAIFLKFFHHELLIDIENTNVQLLRRWAHGNILSGKLRYPWVFDHVLYDRAFDQFAHLPENLSRAETEILLRDTPAGVFQLGTLIVGPFGLLESLQTRLFPPRNDILLSHCSDAACNHAHVATLSLSTPVSSLLSELNKRLQQSGPSSAYYGFISALQAGYSWYDDFSWLNLPWLLGSAFSERETRSLLAEAISYDQGEVRRLFPTDGPGAKKLKGAARDIASRLCKQEAFQVLLLASDACLIRALDTLVDRGEINIPISENRVAMASPEGRSWNRLHCECSQLGARVVSNEGSQPLARLRRLILQVYTSPSDKKQLAWMLGRAAAVGEIRDDTLGREVERFISERPPSSVLRELIFASHDKLCLALALIGAPHFSLPADRSGDRRLTSRILWKLGFPRVHFDSPLETFYEKLDQFREAGSSNQARLEDWKESVRAAGVNFFAVAEEVLDLSLSFCTWLLLSDHFAAGHVFNLRLGRRMVADELSGILRTEDGPLRLSASGDNTLFPLVSGFLALVQRVSDLLQSPDKFKKPEVLLAHYCHDSSLRV